MRYLLASLSHGHAPTYSRCVASFLQNVVPRPDAWVAHVDGDGALPPIHLGLPTPEVVTGGPQQGFCKATGALWRRAAAFPDIDFVWWMESDFVITRPVDLHVLAPVLRDEKIAQVALMRNAVNEQEVAAGGLYELRRAAYKKRDGWLEHTLYFTTNPSLMRRDFMAANPWPDDEKPECEGRYGYQLVTDGFRFAAWGQGETWCEHVGQRTGFGY